MIEEKSNNVKIKVADSAKSVSASAAPIPIMSIVSIKVLEEYEFEK